MYDFSMKTRQNVHIYEIIIAYNLVKKFWELK